MIAVLAVTVVASASLVRDHLAVRRYRSRTAGMDASLRGLEYAAVDPGAVTLASRQPGIRGYPTAGQLGDLTTTHIHLYRERLRQRAISLRMWRTFTVVVAPVLLGVALPSLLAFEREHLSGINWKTADGSLWLAADRDSWLAVALPPALLLLLAIPSLAFVALRARLAQTVHLRRQYTRWLQSTPQGERKP